MLQYIRCSTCECANYKDLDSLSFQDRIGLKKYWLRGYIYDDELSSSKECNCHKRYRLTGRYDRFAKNVELPSFQDLQELKYLGKDDCYTKLKSLPNLVKNKQLRDVLIFINGPANSQKTTSLAKLIHQLIVQDCTINYLHYSNLIENLTNNYTEDFINNLKEVQWLIIDDCFQVDTINYKNIYSKFYNLLLYRKNPTIISSRYSKEKLLSSTDKVFYNKELLENVFEKIDKKNGMLQFTDVVDFGKVRNINDRINLWES